MTNTYVANFTNGDVARRTGTRPFPVAYLVIEDVSGKMKPHYFFPLDEMTANNELVYSDAMIKDRGNTVRFSEVVQTVIDQQQAGLPEYETAAEVAARIAAAANPPIP